MNRILHLILVLAGLVSGFGACPASGRTWQVPDEVVTIAAAIDSAAAGDIVLLACGTYHEYDLVLKPGIIIRSEAGVADCATIDAQQLGRVFTAEGLDQTVVLQGLTLTGGYRAEPTDSGGAIYCHEASLNVVNCTIRDNYAPNHGGGIYAHSSSLLVYNSVLQGNVGEFGGGGGAYLYSTEGEFFNDRFEDNAGIDGAGLFLARCSPDVNFCTFVNNDGWFFGGGVLCISEVGSYFNHCTMAGNDAYSGAGMMVAASSAVTIEMCAIAFNVAGSGVYVDDAGSSVTVRCTDVFGNADGQYTGHVVDPTGSDGNISADPWFCDLASGDVSLAAGSPCLPLGNDCLALMGANLEGCAPTPAGELPLAPLTLEQNRPNPFNPSTTIVFTLAGSAGVDLRVFDLAGRLVAVLWRGEAQAGIHQVEWTGRDDRGREVSSGTYLYRLEAAGRTETRAMQLIR